jgi:DNA (cytosine-5)-methyltransferase 1
VTAALDLFAGMGGWDWGARSLGIEPLGIELDHAACETRRAAGLATAEADVTTLDPADFAPCDLLIASPPCQGFSTAGKRDPRDPRNTGCVVRAE